MAHSVLTEHLVDEPGHPTHDALDRCSTFFRDRLRGLTVQAGPGPGGHVAPQPG